MNEKDSDRVYEIGYHLLPTVDESKILEEVSKIKSFVEENGGSFVGEGFPKITNLSYDIHKNVNSKNLAFNKAYFGWIKFYMDTEKILAIKSKIDNMPNILRYIIVKTVKEETMHTPKIPSFKKESEKKTNNQAVEEIKVSEEEIDKSIDELVVDESL